MQHYMQGINKPEFFLISIFGQEAEIKDLVTSMSLNWLLWVQFGHHDGTSRKLSPGAEEETWYEINADCECSLPLCGSRGHNIEKAQKFHPDPLFLECLPGHSADENMER